MTQAIKILIEARIQGLQHELEALLKQLAALNGVTKSGVLGNPPPSGDAVNKSYVDMLHSQEKEGPSYRSATFGTPASNHIKGNYQAHQDPLYYRFSPRKGRALVPPEEISAKDFIQYLNRTTLRENNPTIKFHIVTEE